MNIQRRACVFYEVVALPKRDTLEILDVGTGSGVLALAAVKLGHRVWGIDHDKESIKEAKRNAKRNSVKEGVVWEHVDGVSYEPDRKFDVILANVFLEPLLKMLSSFKRWTKPKGLLVLSGILHEQNQELIDALEKKNFVVVKRKRVGKWCCLLAQRR